MDETSVRNEGFVVIYSQQSGPFASNERAVGQSNSQVESERIGPARIFGPDPADPAHRTTAGNGILLPCNSSQRFQIYNDVVFLAEA